MVQTIAHIFGPENVHFWGDWGGGGYVDPLVGQDEE